MALNNMANLKLGQLGHIAGSNANNTSATSLASTCRGSSSSTSMRDSFRIGGTSVSTTQTSSGSGDSKGEFGVRVKGDVGEYMGASGGNELIEENGLTTSMNSTTGIWSVEVNESGSGSLYQSRIANNNNNVDDYEGYFNRTHGDIVIGFASPFTEKDKKRASAV